MRTAIAVVLLALAASTAAAQTPALATASASAASMPNWALPTLGGEQFWTDELVFQGWRIQKNAFTEHYRLLDPSDVRRAWGSDEQCRSAWDEIKGREKLPPLTGKAVITLHGLVRSRDHMDGIGRFLTEQGGYHWVNVSYASTRRSLDEHAQSLARVLEGLEGIDEIHFVCHSLGNLVVRRYLGEAQQPEPRWRTDPRIKRMVMLGPPNQGAQLAQHFKDNEFLAMIFGPSAKQLARTWAETQSLLGTPQFAFGILAGGRGSGLVTNPLVQGDDDLIVSVEETRLAGACDFRLIPCLHGRMMDDSGVRRQVLTFLAHGYFTAEGERQPIAAGPAAVQARRP